MIYSKIMFPIALQNSSCPEISMSSHTLCSLSKNCWNEAKGREVKVLVSKAVRL